SDREQTVWVIFNGEIYNFKELRAELEQHGHAFRTRCDTEVIVHGYKQWGPAVFGRLNGMFGLAIWDVERRRLVVARDAMGIKLSGGLDSGLLLALMQEHGRQWPAYTVGYGKTFEDDELADAAESAALLGARHVPVQLDRSEFERSLPSIVSSLEEPIASSS